MNKADFLAALWQRLSYLPEEELSGPFSFYTEAIEDRVEDGMTEDEAVEALGGVEGVARAIEMGMPLTAIVKQRVKEKKERSGGTRPLWIVLAVVGFPIWLPLLITAAALVLTVYVVLWAVIISLYAVVLSLAAAGVAGIVGGFWFLPAGWSSVLLSFGSGLVCAGLAILLFFAFTQVARWLLLLGKKLWLGVKALFIRKKESK